MGDITLSQIATWLTLVVGFITSATFIVNKVKTVIQKALEPTNDKIDKVELELSQRIDDVSMQTNKNFLVRCMADLDNDKKLDPITKERFYEEYENYIKLGGNSYIEREVQRLQKEGKI